MRNKINKKEEESLGVHLFGKIPPQSTELESLVLGAVMLEKDVISKIIPILQPDCFYVEANRKVYEAQLDLFKRSQPIDIITVVEKLKSQGTLEEVGGAYYVTDLTSKVASSANIEYHSRIILQKYISREIIRISSVLTAKAFDDSNDVFDLVDELVKFGMSITDEIHKGKTKDLYLQVNEFIKQIEAAQSSDEHLIGVPTGLHEIDSNIQGFIDSNLIVVAARPGMGKTTLVVQCIAYQVVALKKKILLFTLEMSSTEIIRKLVSNISGVDSESIKSGNLSEQEWQRVFRATDLIQQSVFIIDDTGGLTYVELSAKAKSYFSKTKFDVMYVDYLQLMKSPREDNHHNKSTQVGKASNELKSLAKNLHVPVVALSQLNRSVENNQNKIPSLSDLRESGEIEQDADIVLFVYRPEYYFPDGKDEEGNSFNGLAQVICSKHRDGRLFKTNLKFMGQFSRFMNYGETEYFSDKMF